MLPWGEVAVRQVADFMSGGTPSRKDPRFWGGDIPWITCKDMKGDRISDSLERLTAEGLVAGSRVVLAGSILVVVRGMILARDVPVALTTREVSFNQDLKALMPRDSIDSEFLLYALKSKVPELQRMTARAAHGTKSLLTSNLAELRVPYPPIVEQRKIAVVLSAVQRAIELQGRLITLSRELKQRLMRKLFTEGVRGKGTEQTEIGLIPSTWPVEPLGNHLLASQYGASVKGAESGSTPILRMTNQVEGQIVPNRLQFVTLDESSCRKYRLLPGDILFNRTNSFELVGRTALFDLPGEFIFASYLIRLRVRRRRFGRLFSTII